MGGLLYPAYKEEIVHMKSYTGDELWILYLVQVKEPS